MRTLFASLLALVLSSTSSAREPVRSSAAPLLGLLHAKPGDPRSTFVLQSADGEAAQTVQSFEHLPYAVSRGSMIPGTREAVVVTDRLRRGDGSYGAALLHLAPGRAPIVLADRVFHASRPLVTPSGRVLIQRGTPGEEPSESDAREGHLRSDAITLEEVNLETGATRVIHRFQGYTAHLSGAFEDEVLLYRVKYQHADLVAVKLDGSESRVLLAELPPFARDFFVDAARGRLVYLNLGSSRGTWRVHSLNLRTRESSTLLEGKRPSLAPFVWPDGRLAFTVEGDAGLAVIDARGEPRRISPFGRGMDAFEASTSDGQWVALSHKRPSTLPVPFLIHRELERVVRLPAPEGVRVEVLGFVEGAAR